MQFSNIGVNIVKCEDTTLRERMRIMKIDKDRQTNKISKLTYSRGGTKYVKSSLPAIIIQPRYVLHM